MSIRWRKNLTFIKDPDEVLDYRLDFEDWLDTDTINSETVTVEDGITLDSETNDTTTVTAWLSGGTVGETYTVTYQAVTEAGRTVERSIKVRIKQK